MKVKIKRLLPNIKLPNYFDSTSELCFYTIETMTIENLTTGLIRTGVAVRVPEGYVLNLYPNPRISTNFPNYFANGTELIFPDNNNEIVIVFRNNTFNKTLNIPAYTPIARGILTKFEKVEFEEVDELVEEE